MPKSKDYRDALNHIQEYLDEVVERFLKQYNLGDHFKTVQQRAIAKRDSMPSGFSQDYAYINEMTNGAVEEVIKECGVDPEVAATEFTREYLSGR